jgi:molecular chaperone DnaK
VTPFRIGIHIEGDRVKTIFLKNTQVPSSKKQVVTTSSDYQTSINIYVLEGDSEKALKNSRIAEFTIADIPPAPKGVPLIEVEFMISPDGILESIKARDNATRKVLKVTIVRPSPC